jgi:uncharacterized protein (DUF58 family)
MALNRRVANWLETHWIAPSYSGWLLLGLAIFFFIAGTNTLAGWLYVLSGIGLALIAIAAVLPERTLRSLQIRRPAIHPVSAGDQLTIELIIENPSKQPKTLLQVEEVLPQSLGQGKSPAKSIEAIAPGKAFHWIYCQPTYQRGIYRWETVELRTGAPLGLFWCRRTRLAKATAIVYPTVLPLSRCPMIDEMGRDDNQLELSARRTQAATEGLTRSLRPYRWGDPIRLVHWRTSARYNELRIRELEIFNGGQDLIICLDSATPWQAPSANRDPFEDAVIAAASLYFYACHRHLSVQLWTAKTGLVKGNQVVLETLAEVVTGEIALAETMPNQPLIWLTQNSNSLGTLSAGSRWLLWENLDDSPDRPSRTPVRHRGYIIHDRQPLQHQLESPLRAEIK